MVKKITILGSGTAGYIAALMLKSRFEDLEINIISSKEIGIVGVGEGSTEHWRNFMNYCEITTKDLIQKCDSTFKLAVKFVNWSKKDFIHHVDHIDARQLSKYLYNQATAIIKNKDKKYFTNPFLFDGKVPLSHVEELGYDLTNQFHFDTFKLNNFLKEKALANGIRCYEDYIHEVNFNSRGNVESLVGNKKIYNGDFFIDASGFQKVIIKKLNEFKWVDYKNNFPCNRAFAFQTPLNEPVKFNFFTKSTALNFGWNWQIPTQVRTGNGYVFSKDYVSDEHALLEIENLYGKKIKPLKFFNFTPGRCEESWVNNVLALGLASNFVEPLEATSITTSIQQMFNFIDYFPSNDSKSFNKIQNKLFDNVVDFIQLHYYNNKDNSKFWKDLKNNIIWRDSVIEKINIAQHRLLNRDDFDNNLAGLFSAANWNCILYGLDLFNLDNIKKEYKKTMPQWLINEAEQNYQRKYNYLDNSFLSENFIIDKIKNEENISDTFRA